MLYEIESDEIEDLVPAEDVNVLHFNELAHAYEIRLGPGLAAMFSCLGFVRENRVFFTHSDKTALRIPEWELYADPGAYARLKMLELRQ